jgi:hypothetical protein
MLRRLVTDDALRQLTSKVHAPSAAPRPMKRSF